MLKIEPLLVSTNLSKFTITIFVSWKDIAGLLDVGSQLDLKGEMLSPGDIASVSLEDSTEWATQYQRVSGRVPSEADILLRENEIVDTINYYYTVERVVSEQLDVELLVNDMNKWSVKGPDRPYLFGNIPDSGIGMQYFKSSSGVNLTICAPFMIPYIELFYDRKQILPDWGLDEVEGLDIIEAMVQLQYKLGKRVAFSIYEEEEEEEEVLNECAHRVY